METHPDLRDAVREAADRRLQEISGEASGVRRAVV
jgi:hypothetical protein